MQMEDLQFHPFPCKWYHLTLCYPFSADSHLHLICDLVIVNGAVQRQTCRYLCGAYSRSFAYICKSGIAGSYASSHLGFWRNLPANVYSNWMYCHLSSLAVTKGSFPSHILASVCCSFLGITILTRVRRQYKAVSICFALAAKDVGTFVRCLFAICPSPFENGCSGPQHIYWLDNFFIHL